MTRQACAYPDPVFYTRGFLSHVFRFPIRFRDLMANSHGKNRKRSQIPLQVLDFPVTPTGFDAASSACARKYLLIELQLFPC